jgi:hypothetical protein
MAAHMVEPRPVERAVAFIVASCDGTRQHPFLDLRFRRPLAQSSCRLEFGDETWRNTFTLEY